MAVYLGAHVAAVSIAPDRDDGPERFGDVQVVWRRGQMSVREFHNKQVLVALAGPAAEMIYRQEPLHPGFVAEWADDWRRAWEAAAPLLTDNQKRLALLEQATRQTYDLISLDRHWAAVAALADELAAHERLEGEEIQEILQFWMRRD
jgi:hypothetical protein